jgi:copper chaperone CopZ
VSCTRRVRTTLNAFAEVDSVKVNFKTKVATITLKEGKTLTDKQIKTALKKSGFGVSDIDHG